MLKKIIIALISKLAESLEASILYSQNDLSEVMNYVDIIVNKAQERLKEKFNVSLTLEPPKINICESSEFKPVTVSKFVPKMHIQLCNYILLKLNLNQLIIKKSGYYIELQNYVKTANDLIKDEVENLEKEYINFFKEGFQEKKALNQRVHDCLKCGYVEGEHLNFAKTSNGEQTIEIASAEEQHLWKVL